MSHDAVLDLEAMLIWLERMKSVCDTQTYVLGQTYRELHSWFSYGYHGDAG